MRNYNGDLISGIRQLSKPEYGLGTTDKYGQPAVNWAYLSVYADEDGFDTRVTHQNGFYKIRVRLPYGVILIRYGNEMGHFTAPYGTKYEGLAPALYFMLYLKFHYSAFSSVSFFSASAVSSASS